LEDLSELLLKEHSLLQISWESVQQYLLMLIATYLFASFHVFEDDVDDQFLRHKRATVDVLFHALGNVGSAQSSAVYVFISALNRSPTEMCLNPYLFTILSH
jgi:hypothetical protein